MGCAILTCFRLDILSSRNANAMMLYQFGGSAKVKHLQGALEPMRRILEEQPFLGGSTPNFADLAVAGHFAVNYYPSVLDLSST